MISRIFVRTIKILAFGILLVVGYTGKVAGQEGQETLFDLIYAQEDIEAQLYLDLDSLLVHKMEDRSLLAQIIFISKGDTIFQSPVRITPRGEFRRRECYFPPLLLDFPKSHLRGLQLDSADHYKLVSHCNDALDSNQIVYKEHLTYQLYHTITKKSYRTKWFQINYIDRRGGQTIQSNAFVLESNEEFRRHFRGSWLGDEKVDIDALDAFQVEVAALFQYMIGNRDMHLMGQHNVKILKVPKPRKPLPIPYDFDFSLFVKPTYAYPGLVNRHNVRRIYLGYQRNQRIMPRVFSRFLGVRAELLARISEDEILQQNEREKLHQYLISFYDDLKSNEYHMSYRLN